MSRHLTETLADWTSRFMLSAAESDILARSCTNDFARSTCGLVILANGRASAVGTIKNQIRSLLDKTGDRQLLAATVRVLLEAQGRATEYEGQLEQDLGHGAPKTVAELTVAAEASLG